MIPETVHLNIGSLLFEGLDQIDLTGPFQVLAPPQCNLPHLCEVASTGARHAGAQDHAGCNACGGAAARHPARPRRTGPEALMEDEEVLDWLRSQARARRRSFPSAPAPCVCGGGGAHRERGRPPTGRRSTSFPRSAPSRWTNVSRSMGIGSSRPGSRRELTAPFGSPPRCAASPPPSAFSSPSPMRQSRLFRAGRPRRLLRRSSRRRVKIWPS